MSILSKRLITNLLDWYKINKRDLPWRKTNDAYLIWISEVILQQTRVIQGLPYFYKFVELFPTVQDLANATEQEVLRCWQGLGYYSRARNMHNTAKNVVERYNGKFPTKFNELISLKGIGPYTASAVASFSSNEHVAVLDGNVMRVLTRLFNIDKDIAEEKTRKELQILANEILPIGNAAIHNQAMMELGAVICTPKNTKCEICPFNEFCLAFENSKVDQLPVKLKKIKVKTRYFNYLVIKNTDEKYYMKKRNTKDIWSGLWDFHLIETGESQSEISGLQLDETLRTDLILLETISALKHQLTHQTIWTKFWIFATQNKNAKFFVENDLIPLSIEEVHEVPKPILINNFLNKYLFS